MKMKKAIMSCLLALGFLSASAQDQQPKTEYVFNPHWYVQIQPVGLQHTLGEVDFGDLNSYNVQAAIGRGRARLAQKSTVRSTLGIGSTLLRHLT